MARSPEFRKLRLFFNLDSFFEQPAEKIPTTVCATKKDILDVAHGFNELVLVFSNN